MKDTWDKYCLGSISKWEMDSTSCYFHEHELAAVDMDYYNFEDYFSLPTTPEVETTIRIKNKIIPIFKLSKSIRDEKDICCHNPDAVRGCGRSTDNV